MEGNFREGMNPNTGSEQTSFGNQVNAAFDRGDGASQPDEMAREVSADSDNSGAGLTNRVKGVASSVTSSVKGKASAIPSLLADGLEAGANALRQRSGTPVATTTGASTAIAENSGVTAVTDSLASGMQTSAEWLRDADLDKLKQGVENQVKEHPARSLLIALGAGYILGKALRR
ncbi:MAG: hypothetical protein ACREMS_07590 [Gemmatimonadaceae bacterium]